ncbi:unnamed protein product [Amoebophrya sp. A120]|nr:unnamed protein product [Amoebophrya sp. A120]|eukprot:GSA120T00019980001.1
MLTLCGEKNLSQRPACASLLAWSLICVCFLSRTAPEVSAQTSPEPKHPQNPSNHKGPSSPAAIPPQRIPPARRKQWVQNCPGYRQIGQQLCQFGFDRITRLFATRSCFDADYERSWCCPAPGATHQVVLPDCFIPDGFNSLTPRLCCNNDYTTLAVPPIHAKINLGFGSNLTCLVESEIGKAEEEEENQVRDTASGATRVASSRSTAGNNELLRIFPTLDDIFRDMCPEAREAYQAVTVIWQTMNRRPPTEVAMMNIPDWVSGIKGRYPIFGLLNALLISSPQELERAFVAAAGAPDDDTASKPTSSTSAYKSVTKFHAEDLLIPKRSAVAYLHLALEYFDPYESEDYEGRRAGEGEDETKNRSAVRHRTQLLADQTSSARGSTSTRKRKTRRKKRPPPRWETFVRMAQDAFHKYGWTEEIETHVNYLLDQLWSKWDAPNRWRHIPFEDWRMYDRLSRGVPVLQDKAPKFTVDKPDLNYHVGKVVAVHEVEDQTDSQIVPAVDDENKARGTSAATRPADSYPSWAKPFLFFTDDAALYTESSGGATTGENESSSTPQRPAQPEPCGSYFGIMEKLSKEPEKDVTVLDVGAGTAPCEAHWRSIGKHVKYLKQDFAQYDVLPNSVKRTPSHSTEDHLLEHGKPETQTLNGEDLFEQHQKDRDTKVIEMSKKLGVNQFAFGSSIHAEKGYAKMDIVSDILRIPLASNSIDIIILDQVLEHLPHPADAMKELHRLLKPKGGILFLSHPYGSYLHNLPFHYNGGFTHSWFEFHLGALFLKEEEKKELQAEQRTEVAAGNDEERKDDENSGSTRRSRGQLWWNYRWEKSGAALQRSLSEIDCFQAVLGNFAPGRIFRELLLTLLPEITDVIPGLCPGAERTVQGVNVVAVKG